METRARGVRVPLGLLFVLAVVLAGAAIGWGAIPDSKGRISACYDFEGTGKGKVRVIDAEAGETCRAGEKKLEWYTALEAQLEFVNEDFYEKETTNAGIDLETGQNCATIANTVCYWRVICVPGEVAITGGFHSIDQGTHLISSMPYNPSDSSNIHGWEVRWRNNSTPDSVSVRVMCASRVR